MALIVRRGRSKREVGYGYEADEYDVNQPLVELCVTSSKGLGMFAKQDISRGTRILSEAPLVTVARADVETLPYLWEQLEKLPRAQRDQFDSLACNVELLDSTTRSDVLTAISISGKLQNCDKFFDGYAEEKMHETGIFLTNATRVDANGLSVFPLFSRINHSCTPNVYATYNPSLGTHTVQAIRDVKTGEEILVSYVNCAQPHDQRSRALEDRGVDCHCPACEDTIAAEKSEKRRDRLDDIFRGLKVYDGKLDRKERVPAYLIPRNPTEALAISEEGLTLLKEEGLVGMVLASTYRRSSKYCLQLGMVEKAKAYAKKELEVERYCLGVETEYLTAGNAESWTKQVERTAEKDSVKIRLCEKRVAKEAKKADKKAAKKAGKR